MTATSPSAKNRKNGRQHRRSAPCTWGAGVTQRVISGAPSFVLASVDKSAYDECPLVLHTQLRTLRNKKKPGRADQAGRVR